MKRFFLLTAILLLPMVAWGQDAAVETARRHLAAQQATLKVSDADIADIVVTDAYTDAHSGITHVYFRQRFQGVEIQHANVGVHVKADGTVLTWNGGFIGQLTERINTTAPSLRATDAAEAAARHLNLAAEASFEVKEVSKGGPAQRTLLGDGGIAFEDVPARLVYQPMEDGSLRLAWNLEIYERDQSNYWNMRVDAVSGRVLEQEDWVIHDTWSRHETHTAAPTFSLEARTPLAGPRASSVRQPSLAGSLVPQYRVYAIPNESPRHAGTDQNTARFDGDLRQLVADPSEPVASPLGWLDDGTTTYQITRGNNVWAYEDTQNTGVPLVGPDEPVVAGLSADGGPSQNFDFVLDLTEEPTVEDPTGLVGPQNVSSVITNLFYMNNIMHDVFYQYGFDEASGNMQEENFGRGGIGGDGVRAEAQDGSGVNNANQLTRPDGANPRMQMFIWPQTNGDPTIDGDLDNGVIAHEYGHSISIRMTGGPSTNCLNGGEQAGEGWSDYFGLMLTMQDPGTGIGPGPQDRGIGTYVLNEPPTGDGIRPTRYSPNMAVNPTTYGDISGLSAPHGVGYAFATILWDMTWNLINEKGFNPDVYVNGTDPSAGGNNIALQLVIDGIKLQPCGPTFTASRDAILAADAALFPETDPSTPETSQHERLIWETFARRGVGFSADAGSNAQGDETEAFDIPPHLDTVVSFEKNAPAFVAAGSQLTYTLTANNATAAAISGATITDNVPSGTTFVAGSAACDNGATGGEAGGTVTFGPFTINSGEEVTCTFSVDVAAAPFTTTLFSDDIEGGAGNWATTSVVGVPGNEWQLVTDNPNSGTTSWFVPDPDNFSDQLLELTVDVPLSGNAHLSFWHNYQTEAGFDGGIAEYSTDGGATYQDLGPLMVQEGYNGDIPLVSGFPPLPNTSPIVGLEAFAGGSGGYVQTIADMSSLAGQSVRVRYRFAADVATPATGWWVDDVSFLDLYSLPNEACFAASGVTTICDDIGQFGTIVLEGSVLEVAAKAILEGAFDGGSGMNASLSASGDLPTTQPYDGAAYAGTPMEYGGGERVPVGFFDANPDIVDWVLVDLRTSADPADRVARRAALLKADGSIVDTDGVSGVTFPSVSAADFFVVVRHRNHLPVMSDGLVSGATGTLSVDFTAGQATGFQPMKEVAPGTFALYSGDADGDGQVQNDDKNIQWRSQVGQAGYRAADFNLNGQVQNDDKNFFWRPNSGRGTTIDQ